MTRILLPLDGSPLADRAIPFAAALARSASDGLILVRATQANTLLNVDERDAEAGVVSRAEHELAAAETRLRELGLQTESYVYYERPVLAILDAARRHQADLIVMSTHGRSGLGRMVYGSVADDVLRHAQIPVLLVPATLDHAWPTDRPLTVLVPLDGSELAETALESASLLAHRLGARLHLLRVLTPPPYPLSGDGYVYIPLDDEAERADARQYLQAQAEKLASQGVQATVEVASGPPDAVIARAAVEQRADVIAMATHGRGGLARLVLGSVATGTLLRAHVPLLLTRPAELGQLEPLPPVEDLTDPEPATIALSLTPPELALVRRALESLPLASHEEPVAGQLRALLSRLDAARPAVPTSAHSVDDENRIR